ASAIAAKSVGDITVKPPASSSSYRIISCNTRAPCSGDACCKRSSMKRDTTRKPGGRPSFRRTRYGIAETSTKYLWPPVSSLSAARRSRDDVHPRGGRRRARIRPCSLGRASRRQGGRSAALGDHRGGHPLWRVEGSERLERWLHDVGRCRAWHARVHGPCAGC